MIRLGVNIDHVATLREARRIAEPDPAWAVVLAELGGADQITLHLREDRRHIRDEDLEKILRVASVPVNLEMAITREMLDIAAATRPHSVTLVPEKREEVTTEGGLAVAGQEGSVGAAVKALAAAGIAVSLFVDPDPAQVAAASACGARAVELHTGAYCGAADAATTAGELARLRAAADQSSRLGLRVHAGHGLNVRHVAAVARIPQVEELNIGHALIGRAVFVGLQAAVAEMKAILHRARAQR